MYEANPNVIRPGSKTTNFVRDNGLLIVIAGAIAVFLLADQAGWLTSPHALTGKTAPPFSLTTLDAKTVSLADHLGKDVVLLDFFATWCPPCRESLPHVEEITKDYAGKSVAVYAVNVGEGQALVQKFIADNKLTLNVLMDESGAAAEAYGVSGIPQQVVIGKDGMINYVGVGFGMGDASTLRSKIDALLASS